MPVGDPCPRGFGKQPQPLPGHLSRPHATMVDASPMEPRHRVGARWRQKRGPQDFEITEASERHGLTLTPITEPVRQPDTRYVGEKFPVPHLWPDTLDRDPAWTYIGSGD